MAAFMKSIQLETEIWTELTGNVTYWPIHLDVFTDTDDEYSAKKMRELAGSTRSLKTHSHQVKT